MDTTAPLLVAGGTLFDDGSQQRRVGKCQRLACIEADLRAGANGSQKEDAAIANCVVTDLFARQAAVHAVGEEVDGRAQLIDGERSNVELTPVSEISFVDAFERREQDAEAVDARYTEVEMSIVCATMQTRLVAQEPLIAPMRSSRSSLTI